MAAACIHHKEYRSSAKNLVSYHACRAETSSTESRLTDIRPLLESHKKKIAPQIQMSRPSAARGPLTWFLLVVTMSLRQSDCFRRVGARPFTSSSGRGSSSMRATTAASSGEDWYKDGLSFACHSCGHCCSGSTGSVRFTDAEAAAMAARLHVTKDQFYDQYTRKRGRAKNAYVELKEKRTARHGYDCVFLDRDTVPGKAICSLYEARPAQCRTWPFWEENLTSKAVWERVRLGPEGCKGIGAGPVVAYRDIVAQRETTKALWGDQALQEEGGGVEKQVHVVEDVGEMTSGKGV